MASRTTWSGSERTRRAGVRAGGRRRQRRLRRGSGGGGRSAQTHVTVDDTVSDDVMDGEMLQLTDVDALTDVLAVSVLLTVVEGV